MRFTYVLNEAMIGLWRNVTMTLAMIITMSVSLTMLGVGVLLYFQVGQIRDYHYGKIEVTVFLRGDVTDAQRAGLDAALRTNPYVADRKYESKEEAYARFQEAWRDAPDFVEAVGPDVLPESFRVKLKDPRQYKAFVSGIEDRRGIDLIVDQRRLLEKVFTVFNGVQRTALVFACLMGVAAVLLVGNTIQVAAYSKRREVAVMKMVGASNWFVQAPFVVEAVVAGTIGAVVGFAMLLAGKFFVLEGWLRALTSVFPPVPNDRMSLMLPLLVGIGAAVSGCTAWVTLRFYVRV